MFPASSGREPRPSRTTGRRDRPVGHPTGAQRAEALISATHDETGGTATVQSMPLDDWVAHTGSGDATSPVRAFLDELGDMLDEYRPTKLAPEHSSLVWRDAGIEVTLAHREQADGDIVVVLEDREATIAWAATHEHVYPQDAVAGERAWTSLIVDAVAAALRGEFIFEVVHRGRVWVRTRTIVIDDDTEQVLATTGSMWGWLVLWQPPRVTRQRIDYGVTDPG